MSKVTLQLSKCRVIVKYLGSEMDSTPILMSQILIRLPDKLKFFMMCLCSDGGARPSWLCYWWSEWRRGERHILEDSHSLHRPTTKEQAKILHGCGVSPCSLRYYKVVDRPLRKIMCIKW